MPRIANDAYYTQTSLAEDICWRLKRLIGDPVSIQEPSSGGGAFIKGAHKTWPESKIFAFDIDPNCGDAAMKSGAVVFGTEDHEVGYSLVLGNPPYSLAEEFVTKAFTQVMDRGHIAFLLRLSFLGSVRRYENIYTRLHRLRWLIPVIPRPSFTADGRTDNSEYACFVWEKGYHGSGEILGHIKWR